MRSLSRRFEMYQKAQPELSTLMNFAATIRGQGFSKDMISRWFNYLVDRDDYARNDKRMILQSLQTLTEAEDNGKTTLNASLSIDLPKTEVLSH